MDPCNKSLESADALTALRTTYYSRFPEHSFLATTHSEAHLTVEDTGVAGNDYEQVVNSKFIGRQAFLLDESLRHAHDGKLLRPPLDDIKRQSSACSRGKSTLWNVFDQPLSAYGWRLPEQRDTEEGLKPRAGQGARLMLVPVSRLTTTEDVGAMNTPVAGLQEQALVGKPQSEALVQEMYHEFIDEALCCELGGWLNDNK